MLLNQLQPTCMEHHSLCSLVVPLQNVYAPKAPRMFSFYIKKHSHGAMLFEKDKPDKLVLALFLVVKSLTNTIGQGSKASKMASGDLLLEASHEPQGEAWHACRKLPAFANPPITVTPTSLPKQSPTCDRRCRLARTH